MAKKATKRAPAKRKKPAGRYDTYILSSGGPDSATLLADIVAKGKKPLAFHFSTGLPDGEYELRAAKATTKHYNVPLQVLDISHFVFAAGDKKPTIHSEAHVLQFGTAALLSMAAAIAIENDIPSIQIALHADDAEESNEYGPEFMEWVNSGIALIGAKCKVAIPYHKMTKQQVFARAKKLSMPLEKTWSCITPIRDQQCGTCGACRARIASAESAKIEDRTKYKF